MKKIILLLPLICSMLSSCQQGPKQYTITWKNYDDAILSVTHVNANELPNFDKQIPTKPPEETKEYTFSGWSPTVVPAKEDATYKATFTEGVRHFTITWKNEGESRPLSQTRVELNHLPRFDKGTPSKDPTHDKQYVFEKWVPNIAPATKDMTYEAHYREETRCYLITWENYNHTPLIKTSVPLGTTPSYPTYAPEPTRPETSDIVYRFSGWSPKLTPVTGPATYVATFDTYYKIKFNPNGGTWNDGTTEAKIVPTKAGEMPVPPASPKKESSEKYCYPFIEWNHNLEPATKAAEYVAIYKQEQFYKSIKINCSNGLCVFNSQGEKVTTLEIEDAMYDTEVSFAFTSLDGKNVDPDLKSFLVRGKSSTDYTLDGFNTITFKVNGDTAIEAVGIPILPEAIARFTFDYDSSRSEEERKVDFNIFIRPYPEPPHPITFRVYWGDSQANTATSHVYEVVRGNTHRTYQIIITTIQRMDFDIRLSDSGKPFSLGNNFITNIKFYRDIKSVRPSAFSYLQSLTTFIANPELETISEKAFLGSNICNAIFPTKSNLKTIDKQAFMSCRYLYGNSEHIFRLPSSLEFIKSGAFCYCSFENLIYEGKNSFTLEEGSLKVDTLKIFDISLITSKTQTPNATGDFLKDVRPYIYVYDSIIAASLKLKSEFWNKYANCIKVKPTSISV